MSELSDLLALLPDNNTGEIDAADLRYIVTALWNDTNALVGRVTALEQLPGRVTTLENEVARQGTEDVKLEARVSALEAEHAGEEGDVFSVTGVWQVNPTPNAEPQGGQMAGNTTTLGTATVLKFAALDRLNQDSRAALLASTAIFAQQKSNSSNWVTYDVTGTPTLNGSTVTVPVAVQKSSGVAGAVAWQEAAVVINVQTTAVGEF